MHYLYIATMCSYGARHPTKIGISKNVANRLRQLRNTYGGLAPELFAVYEMPNEAAARRVETLVVRHFPKATRCVRPGRELLESEASKAAAWVEKLGLVRHEIL